ncbi:MAG: phage major capsid protein, partial [Parabacteroides sp.]|nr:phage major capsid protein [Parabacteroides sp.]
MNKKMRDLLAKHDLKVKEAKSFMEGETKDLEAFNKAMDEADAIMAEYNAEKRMFETEKASVATDPGADPQSEDPAEKGQKAPKDSIKEFADMARKGFNLPKTMSEGTSADGGYTVPEDIQTQINTYKESKFSLLSLVKVENVTTEKGQRTFKKRAQQTGFVKVGEGGKIGAKATPQFERISFEIGKYAGYFPVTNELLEDSDANIAQTLIEWIGDESRVTANKLILAVIGAKTVVNLENLDGIKKAFNVTLGSAFKASSAIVTNDDGLQYLDTLKDNTGRYLLSPDPTKPMEMRLAVGATFVPVKVIPNDDLANAEAYVKTADTDIVAGKAYYTLADTVYTLVATPLKANIATYYEIETRVPMILGDLNEGIVFFDRKKINIKTSDVAVTGELNAFEEDLTLYRAIEREDVNERDSKAYVNGYIV